MTRIILHIGPHKTGSTYIQSRLYEHRQAMRAEGVDYWENGLDASGAHHTVASVTRSGDEAALASLLAPLASAEADSILLSSENFDLLRLPGIARLRAALRGTSEVTVVFFVRDATELLLSTWQENVKHGGVLAFDEFCGPHLWAPKASPILNPCLVLDGWRKVFGIQALRVVDYDDAKAAGDLMGAFAEASACPSLGSIGAPSRKNVSMEPWLTEFMRCLNACAAEDNLLRGPNVRQELLRHRKTNPVMQALLADGQSLIARGMRAVSLRGGELERIARRGLAAYPRVPLPGAGDGAKRFRVRTVPASQWLCGHSGRAVVEQAYHILKPTLQSTCVLPDPRS